MDLLSQTFSMTQNDQLGYDLDNYDAPDIVFSFDRPSVDSGKWSSLNMKRILGAHLFKVLKVHAKFTNFRVFGTGTRAYEGRANR